MRLTAGEIPRIFGELLTVLERDKRGKPVLLPLSQERFQVPQNVYIIGTMNTADRSIALLDTALRRRFGFVELMPDYELLRYAATGGIPLGPWLESLNSRIRKYVGRDARNLQVGHAYLLQKGQPITDFTTFAQVVQDDIIPLLEEYCYEDYPILEKILGTGLVDVKNQQVNHDLFTSSEQANLIRALIAPDPDITTTTQAITAEEQASSEQVAESDYDDVDGNGRV
jgi:5-methylcytosine-specific restriction protein B